MANDPKRTEAQTEAEAAEAKAYAAQKQAPDTQHRDESQQRLAVDENDPRVAPHLEAGAPNYAVITAEENARRAHALDEARQRVDESAAKVAAALDNYNTAGEVLTAARTEHVANLEAYSRLDRVGPTALAEQIRPGEPTVLMFFPRAVRLNTGVMMADFPAGVHAVPESLSRHQWLADNGVRLFKGNLPTPEKPDEEPFDPEHARRRPLSERMSATG